MQASAESHNEGKEYLNKEMYRAFLVYSRWLKYM